MGLCFLKRINNKVYSSPLTSYELQNGFTHRFASLTCHNCIFESSTMSTGRGSTGWRIKRSTRESSMSFLSLEVDHWLGLQRRGRSYYSPCFILPSTTELHLMCIVSLPPFTGWFVEAIIIDSEMKIMVLIKKPRQYLHPDSNISFCKIPDAR